MLSSNRTVNKTVMLTGAGGAAVPFLIKQLKTSGYRVISADMDSLAVGHYFADRPYIVPKATSPDFLPRLREICNLEKVDAIVPLVDEELRYAWQLNDDGVCVILPRLSFVETCLDKYKLMEELKNFDINVPNTKLASDNLSQFNYPVIVKPRVGRGSRGVGIIHNERELDSFLDSSPYTREELLIQDYIDGTEFTVSVVVWRDGKVRAVVPKEIISKKGITKIAVTRFVSSIEMICHKIQDCMKADGPFNVQLKIQRESGLPYVFEINPRFSTSILLTIAAGVNEIELILAQALFEDVSSEKLEWREGLVMLRQYLDEFIDEKEYLAFRSKLK